MSNGLKRYIEEQKKEKVPVLSEPSRALTGDPKRLPPQEVPVDTDVSKSALTVQNEAYTIEPEMASFLAEVEGVKNDVYVPKKGGVVIGNSGATIASGFDLGQRTDISEYNLSPELEAKLKPYLGKKRDVADAYVKEHPLKLSDTEVAEINSKVKGKEVAKVKARFNKDSELDFDSLPIGAKTALVSVLFQYGSPSKVPTFWRHATEGNWNSAIAELDNFGDNYDTRRRKEASLIEGTGLSSIVRAGTKKRKV